MEAGQANGVPAPFIVGVARSGTTLLRLMLDAHPDLAIPPETHFVPRVIKRVDGGAGAAEVASFLEQHPRWGDFGLDATELTRRLAALPAFDAGNALRAFYGLYAEGQGKPRWGDKSPPYVNRMARIQSVLGEARFIHVIRDGRDVALSLASVSWGPGEAAEVAQKWVDEIGKARRQAARKLDPGTYHEVHYEELVADPESVLREVAETIELPWDPSMLAYHERAGERMGEVERDFTPGGGEVISASERADQHALVREPPRSDRAGRWREQMSAEDRAAFEEIAGELLGELGYPLD
jgi:hypothetical protein